MNNELDDMIHRIEEASKRTIVGGGGGSGVGAAASGLESLPPIRKAESIPGVTTKKRASHFYTKTFSPEVCTLSPFSESKVIRFWTK